MVRGTGGHRLSRLFLGVFEAQNKYDSVEDEGTHNSPDSEEHIACPLAFV